MEVRAKIWGQIIGLLLIGLCSIPCLSQNCLSYEVPVTLTGTLTSRIFAGPPNYESIKRGDRKETAIILRLVRPICTTGTDWPDLSFTNIRDVQLVIYKAEQWKTVDRRMGKRVDVSGTLFGANTGHHRTKVLISVSTIRAPHLTEATLRSYPTRWFTPINDPNKPDWEILPQEAKAGEVILSKRNELGILSNFAATPFVLDGNRYASVEGFWQMMLYPEPCPDCDPDPRMLSKKVTWKYYASQVAQMTGFEAKAAGTLAEENMKTLGIDWCTYRGKRFPYRSPTPGEHYRLILAAMRAKLDQNPEVKRILLATGDLKLRPDHIEEENAPPEWHYYDIWMQLRSELQKR